MRSVEISSFHLWISALTSDDEARLNVDLFRGYQALLRPIQSINDSALTVSIGLQLILLINVDEKNQIVHTNVWLTVEWEDFQIKWNPTDYGGVEKIRVPPDKVWQPDLVLFNNADGVFEVTYYSNVVIDYKGHMLWVPPAIYKSSCIIDVEHFPFDEQTCTLNFGSWTFNKYEVELSFLKGSDLIDLSYYEKSAIWDLIDCPAHKTSRRNLIMYQLVIRRKTLFYTMVLITPTVLMAFLSVMVFYLPTKAGEKITLAISILLSLVVFLLLVSKILPASSKTIPLMAKYLLLTFVLNVLTILITVIVVNVYFRGPTTHRLPNWVRKIFLDLVAKLLLMKRPKLTLPPRPPGAEGGLVNSVPIFNPPAVVATPHVLIPPHKFTTYGLPIAPDPTPVIEIEEADEEKYDPFEGIDVILTPEAYRAIEAIDYITEHLTQDEEYKKVKDDWMYVSMVIDRILLYVFFGVTLGGTLGIIVSAPNIFEVVDQDAIKMKLIAKYNGEI